MLKKKQGEKDGSSTSYMDLKSQKMEIRSIMKDIEFLGSKHMTWKQRKELENRKVISLGGKPVKKHRLPLSVARVIMKKQKERDQKVLQELLMIAPLSSTAMPTQLYHKTTVVNDSTFQSSILGRVGGKFTSGSKRTAEKRNPEDRVLKSTVGTFRNGVLDVKNLLQEPAPSRDGDGSSHGGSKGKKRKGGKRKQGKKKGGGRKRH